MNSHFALEGTTIAPVSPEAVAAGLGLASREEISGLLALLEVTSAINLAKGAVDEVRRKLGSDLPGMSEEVRRRAEAIRDGGVPSGVLRHRLWTIMCDALGIDAVFPLSTRRTREATAAIGVRAAQILSPGLASRRRETEDGKTEVGQKPGWDAGRFLKAPFDLFGPRHTFSFPEIVADEAFQLIGGLSAAGVDGQLDPEARTALEVAQSKAVVAALAGGTWAGLAALVQAAGFAPYILAAQASAFVPFVGGPAAVSLLAVLVNPVTLIAGLAALGYWGVQGQANKARSVAAARIAAILALRGMRYEPEGIAGLVTAFRGLAHRGSSGLAHLGHLRDRAARAKVVRLETRIGRRLPEAIARPLDPGRDTPAVERRWLDLDVPVMGAMTAADLLYHAAAIDPKVLAAADFSRTLDIGAPADLAACIDAFGSQGAQISLRGYTAEQMVASHFVAAGHAVELPSSANNPGFDLLIDGAPVQVKCGVSADLLVKHFARYPDIPVIANGELADLASDLDPEFAQLVTSFQGFDISTVEDILDRSLAGAAGLADIDVPLFAMVVGAGRGAYRAWQGEIPVEDLQVSLVIDLATRGTIAAGGKLTGGAVGLLVIGPAGAVILAPLVGVVALLGVNTAKTKIDRMMRHDWQRDVMEEAGRLYASVVTAQERRREGLFDRVTAIARYRDMAADDISELIFRQAVEDAIYADEIVDELKQPRDLSDLPGLMLLAARHAPVDAAVIRCREGLLAAIKRRPPISVAVNRLMHRFRR